MDFEKMINTNLEKYKGMIKKMYDNPELGNKEYASSKLLAEFLLSNGFEVTYPFILETGFKAGYKSTSPGPRIALLCEYDALPEVGHGCGHNMIGVVSVASAIILKQSVLEYGGELLVFGTPAEETYGGKINFAKAKVFDDCDAVLMMHPSNNYGLGGKTLALNPVKFEFFGKNAHACRPQFGKSALDAAVLTYTSINMLRQFQLPHTYIHGIIRDGGEAANIIPGYASLEYYFRGTTMANVKKLSDDAISYADNAAKIAGVTLKSSIYETPYEECVVNYTLANILKDKFKECGVTEELNVAEDPVGSSDIGAVSYRCPVLQGTFKIAPSDVLEHSREMASATISKDGTKGFVLAVKVLSLVGMELFSNPQKLEEVKNEFKQR